MRRLSSVRPFILDVGDLSSPDLISLSVMSPWRSLARLLMNARTARPRDAMQPCAHHVFVFTYPPLSPIRRAREREPSFVNSAAAGKENAFIFGISLRKTLGKPLRSWRGSEAYPLTKMFSKIYLHSRHFLGTLSELDIWLSCLWLHEVSS